MPRFVINNLPYAVDFECGDDLVARTLQNAKNLLMTRRGEVPYDRDRGFDRALFDLPADQLRTRLVPELDRVMSWDPDIEVVDADFSLTADGGTVVQVTIDITIED